MKKLLLFVSVCLSSIAGYAQETCDTAIELTGSGTNVVDTIVGEYPATGCWQTAASAAMWYSFTPASNGLITVTSDIAANPSGPNGTDSRLSIFTGSCDALTCINGSDDIQTTAPENYRSTVADQEVMAGETYFIVWDDRWSDAGFSFEFTFTPVECFSPTGFAFSTLPTTTEAGITWDAPTVGTPEGYQFEYGVQGFVQGTGTVLNLDTNTADLTNLTSGTVYSFYVRTFCGGTEYSTWVGPIAFATQFTPAIIPYTMSFDQSTNLDFIGWTSSITGTAFDWNIRNDLAAALVNDGTSSIVSVSSTAAPTNERLYSRGISLAAGQQVALSFFYRNVNVAPNTSVGSFVVSVGTDDTEEAQTTVLTANLEFTNETFEQASTTFTAPAAGIYYFSFLNESEQNTTGGTHAIIFDTFSFQAPLSVNNPEGSKLAVFPNPTTDVLNITNLNGGFAGATLTDLNGRTVKTIAGKAGNEIQISIADLAAGVYMLNVTSNEGAVSTSKVIKK